MIEKIHKNSHVSNGSKLFHETMVKARAILGETWSEYEENFLKIGFWATYENIILGMAMDEDVEKRNVAAHEIQAAWNRRQNTIKGILRKNPNEENPEKRLAIRKFQVLPHLIDTQAEDYSKMVPFDKLKPLQKTIPPLILDIILKKGIVEVVRLIMEGSLPMIDVPCHSQAGGHSYSIWNKLLYSLHI